MGPLVAQVGDSGCRNMANLSPRKNKEVLVYLRTHKLAFREALVNPSLSSNCDFYRRIFRLVTNHFFVIQTKRYLTRIPQGTPGTLLDSWVFVSVVASNQNLQISSQDQRCCVVRRLNLSVPPQSMMSVAIYDPQQDVGDTICQLVNTGSDR